PRVAVEHLRRQVLERLLEDVLAGRSARRAAGDDRLQAAQTLARLVVDALARRERRPEGVERRLTLRQPVADLGHLGVLGSAAGLQVGAELRQVSRVALRPASEGGHEGPERGRAANYEHQ